MPWALQVAPLRIASTEVVVQFYPWFKLVFCLFTNVLQLLVNTKEDHKLPATTKETL